MHNTDVPQERRGLSLTAPNLWACVQAVLLALVVASAPSRASTYIIEFAEIGTANDVRREDIYSSFAHTPYQNTGNSAAAPDGRHELRAVMLPLDYAVDKQVENRTGQRITADRERQDAPWPAEAHITSPGDADMTTWHTRSEISPRLTAEEEQIGFYDAVRNGGRRRALNLDKLYAHAKAGNPCAQYYIRDLTNVFGGSEQTRPKQAVSWLINSARSGYVPAQHLMGVWHLQEGDAERMWRTGKKWLDIAKKNGSVGAKSDMGCMYTFGMYGLPVDRENGRKLLIAAANLDASGIVGSCGAEAMFVLGLSYLPEVVCGDAPMRGIKLVHAAANRGSAAALRLLGAIYACGTYFAPDHAAAVKFLQEAARMYNRGAIKSLGDMYRGEGIVAEKPDVRRAEAYHAMLNAAVPPKSDVEIFSPKRTFKTQRHAAERLGETGGASGMEIHLTLGHMCEWGLSVPRDLEAARYHYERAAKSGSSAAIDRLEMLDSRQNIQVT